MFYRCSPTARAMRAAHFLATRDLVVLRLGPLPCSAMIGRSCAESTSDTKPHLSMPAVLLTVLAGDLKLDGLRVNQLKLCKQLAGSLSLSDRGLHLQARGQRPDEALDLDLAAGILSMPSPAGEQQRRDVTDGAAQKAAPEATAQQLSPQAGFAYGQYAIEPAVTSSRLSRKAAGAVASVHSGEVASTMVAP